uniref:Uncharacterized protein n=1 Tax=Candidatus Kentrum sp. LFY TaxID=2126342 RepID=A0A450V4R3_9GAMM|nr:MAG: hypothetical protein BECKLFY1418A_GA0070994_11059 [Candidatus Kentron sp. LFY]
MSRAKRSDPWNDERASMQKGNDLPWLMDMEAVREREFGPGIGDGPGIEGCIDDPHYRQPFGKKADQS